MKYSKLLSYTALVTSMYAASVNAAVIPLPAGIAVLEDDNIEYVTDSNGNFKTTGTLEVGDTLWAFVTFDKVQDNSSTTITELGAPGLELTGISAIEIHDITGSTYTFKPNTAFESEYGTGAMAALFAHTAGNFFTSCNSSAASPINVDNCKDAATDGDPWMTGGFLDDDDFWVAAGNPLIPGFGSIDAVKAAGSTDKLGVANYALSILSNSSGYEFNQQFSAGSATFGSLGAGGSDSMTDILGSGDILGGSGLAAPFFARSDFDFRLDVIPEPNSIALFALGLLGAGAIARRRKS